MAKRSSNGTNATTGSDEEEDEEEDETLKHHQKKKKIQVGLIIKPDKTMVLSLPRDEIKSMWA